mgnify:CR=1 FL=1
MCSDGICNASNDLKARGEFVQGHLKHTLHALRIPTETYGYLHTPATNTKRTYAVGIVIRSGSIDKVKNWLFLANKRTFNSLRIPVDTNKRHG